MRFTDLDAFSKRKGKIMNSLKSQSGNSCAGKILFRLITLIILSAPLAVHGETPEGSTDDTGNSLNPLLDDMRIFVKMPENVRKILQGDMLDHLAAINEINRLLSENDLSAAAEIAETGMGRNLLNQYQDVHMRPGQYMPREMREIGWELHSAATEFADSARAGDLQKALRAYNRITSACVACHYSYRTQ
jgi:hypothetical protein